LHFLDLLTLSTPAHSSAEQTFLDNLDKKLWNAASRLRSNLDATSYQHTISRRAKPPKAIQRRCTHRDRSADIYHTPKSIVDAPKPPLLPEVGYTLVRRQKLRAHAIRNMTSTKCRQCLPAECFDSFLSTKPSPEIAKRFGELVAPIFAEIKSYSNNLPPNNPRRHAAAQAAAQGTK
jgi:hypothetical protein